MSQENAQIKSVRYIKNYKLDVTWSNRRTLNCRLFGANFPTKGIAPDSRYSCLCARLCRGRWLQRRMER